MDRVGLSYAQGGDTIAEGYFHQDRYSARHRYNIVNCAISHDLAKSPAKADRYTLDRQSHLKNTSF
jgi:hypothetical protein